MDGNGRWAKARGLPRAAGHRRGADAVRRVVRGAGELGIPMLTLFAFSTENWTRPADEVARPDGPAAPLSAERARGAAQERRPSARHRQSPGPAATTSWAASPMPRGMTRSNSRIDVNICINYGARAEILHATRSLARRVAFGELSPERIDEQSVRARIADGRRARPGPADPYQRRAAHQQLSAMAVRLRRAGVRRHARGRISARSIWSRRSPSFAGASVAMAASAADAATARAAAVSGPAAAHRLRRCPGAAGVRRRSGSAFLGSTCWRRLPRR